MDTSIGSAGIGDSAPPTDETDKPTARVAEVVPSTTTNSANPTGSLQKSPDTETETKVVLTDEVVLEYLKKKGLGTAALELSSHMEKYPRDQEVTEYSTKATKETTAITASKTNKKAEEMDQKERLKKVREHLEEEDAIFREQRSMLAKVRFVTVLLCMHNGTSKLLPENPSW